MRSLSRRAGPALLAGLLLAIPAVAQAQAGQTTRRQVYDAQGRYVYATFQTVNWNRVDSLVQLRAAVFPAVRAKAIEMGCYLDQQMLIHHTGNAQNVVTLTYYPTWEAVNNTGCQGRAFVAAIPDSARRAAVVAGNNWVFEGGGAHNDIIYWEPNPRP